MTSWDDLDIYWWKERHLPQYRLCRSPLPTWASIFLGGVAHLFLFLPIRGGKSAKSPGARPGSEVSVSIRRFPCFFHEVFLAYPLKLPP